MANGRALVKVPAFTPGKYGLFSVAQNRTAEMGAHWGAGITWQPLCAAGDTTYDECVTTDATPPAPAPSTKTATFDSVRQAATPFTVYVRKDCSIPTYYDEATGEVREALTESEAFQVENAFWTGIVDGQEVAWPHLAADAPVISDRDTLQYEADVVGSGATDIILGLGLLEQAASQCLAGQATLHLTIAAASAAAAWGLIHLMGDHYETTSGNLVAIGHGYNGSSPDGTGATPASTWIYATGPVFYARGDLLQPTPKQGVVLNENTLEQMAERTYVVGYDCCLLTTEIDLTLTTGGSSGGGGGGGDASAANQVSQINLATTLNTLVDGVETLLTAIDGNTNGLETLAGTTNSTLATIDTHVDGLETLVTTGNASLVSILAATDGLETLVTATNALLTALNPTILYAKVDTASSGGTDLVVAQGASQRIRVLSYTLVAAGAVNVKFTGGTGPTDLTGAMPFVANSGAANNSSQFGLFATAANAKLSINLSGAVQVSGHIAYIVTT